MTIEKLEEFASNGDKHLTGLDVATGFPRADKPERPWFNKLFGDITGKINEVVDNIDELPPFEGGVLADTFVVVDGSLSQRTMNRGLESIADLSTINNPKDGLRVYVKSYHVGLNKGGGTFIYDSSKSSINNEGTIINGWVRQGVTNTITPQMFGAIGNGREGDQACVSKAYEYLNSIGGGTLFMPDGLYLIDTVNYIKEAETGASLNEQYAFPIYSNITVAGQSKGNTIFKMADGIIYKNLNEANIGCALFADAHRRVHIENFKLTNFKVDMNGINNTVVDLPTGGGVDGAPQQAIFPVLYFFDYYTSYNITMESVWVHQNSGLNSVYVGHRSTHTTIKDCLFTDHADYVVGNTEITDHSTIFISGLNNLVTGNKFIMNHDPVSNVPRPRTSYISTAVEAHGVNTVVSNNIVDGYSAPFLAASTEYYNGDNILFIGNMVYQAQIGFAFNSMNGTLRTSFVGNTVYLRKEKASTANNSIRYAHAAVESVGAINSVLDYATALSNVFVFNNTFEQEQPTDWLVEDNAINSCMNIKETQSFTAKGNTFKNFKGAAVKVLAHRNWLNTKIDISNNTYIGCGSDDFYNPVYAAYLLSDGAFVNENGYDFNELSRIDVTNDKFINCSYGVLLGKMNDLTAKNIAITGIEYMGTFVPPFLAIKPIDAAKNHDVHISYEADGLVDATHTLANSQSLSGEISMRNWSTDPNNNVLKSIKYTKTTYFSWNMRGLGVAPTVTGKYGAFENVNGDRVEVLTPTTNTFQKYTFFEGGWYGTGKIEIANKLL